MRGRVLSAAWLPFAAGFGLGQPTLLTSDEVLGRMDKQFAGGLPACVELNQLRRGAHDDLQWLTKRLKGTKVDPLYMASLEDLSTAIRESAKDRNLQTACNTLRLVVADLRTKRQDCRALGHSRTNISVEIRTLQGREEVAGWEVYARWLPAGDRFSTVPKRLQVLSSPARGTVPIPGEYEIHAKNASSGVMTDPVRVSIGGAPTFIWPLPVPVAKDKQREK